jgi:hypothetical protein
MARLRIQEIARKRGLNISQLQAMIHRRSNRLVALGTMRRYWYSTQNGKEHGPPIELVDLPLLATIATALGVGLADLVNEDELGQSQAAFLAA